MESQIKKARRLPTLLIVIYVVISVIVLTIISAVVPPLAIIMGLYIPFLAVGAVLALVKSLASKPKGIRQVIGNSLRGWVYVI